MRPQGAAGQWCERLALGRSVKKGEAVLSFDLLTGDQLFVDRLSYHFHAAETGAGLRFSHRPD